MCPGALYRKSFFSATQSHPKIVQQRKMTRVECLEVLNVYTHGIYEGVLFNLLHQINLFTFPQEWEIWWIPWRKHKRLQSKPKLSTGSLCLLLSLEMVRISFGEMKPTVSSLSNSYLLSLKDPSQQVYATFNGLGAPIGLKVSDAIAAQGGEAVSLACTQAMVDAHAKSQTTSTSIYIRKRQISVVRKSFTPSYNRY